MCSVVSYSPSVSLTRQDSLLRFYKLFLHWLKPLLREWMSSEPYLLRWCDNSIKRFFVNLSWDLLLINTLCSSITVTGLDLTFIFSRDWIWNFGIFTLRLLYTNIKNIGLFVVNVVVNPMFDVDSCRANIICFPKLCPTDRTHQILPGAYSVRRKISRNTLQRSFRYGSEDIRVGILVRVLRWPYWTQNVDNVQHGRSTTLNEKGERVVHAFVNDFRK